MQIKNAEFVKSAVLQKDWPTDSLPQIALAGRSNVGKSSLINSLANNSKLARTSNTPGKTRVLNFYLCNNSFYLVDLPGYGYANVSVAEKDKWGDMIESYLKGEPSIALIVQLVDIRHKPTLEDIQMMQWIKHSGFSTVVVATKSDKISKSSVNNSLADIRSSLKIGFDENLIPFSSRTGQGKEVLLSIINYVLTN